MLRAAKIILIFLMAAQVICIKCYAEFNPDSAESSSLDSFQTYQETERNNIQQNMNQAEPQTVKFQDTLSRNSEVSLAQAREGGITNSNINTTNTSAAAGAPGPLAPPKG